jgi:hypothetical protein
MKKQSRHAVKKEKSSATKAFSPARRSRLWQFYCGLWGDPKGLK